MMKQALFILVTSMVAMGCMASRYAYHERHDHPVAADTLTMTKEDVIALSREGVSDDVIIDQIRVTNSQFVLSKDDILELKKSGVSEEVIRAMIKTSERGQPRRTVREYSWSPYLAGYPWYPGFWWGFSFRYYRPYYYYIAPRIAFIHRTPLHGHSRSSGWMRR
jgi:hypothetical protein